MPPLKRRVSGNLAGRTHGSVLQDQLTRHPFPRSIAEGRLIHPRVRVNRYFEYAKVQPDVPFAPGQRGQISSTSSAKRSSDAGLLRDSLLAASSGGVPESIFLTGTSSFLPFRVLGISGTANISLGTCLGEAFSLMLDLILLSRSSSSSTPSCRPTKSSIKELPPSPGTSTTRLSVTSSTLSTAE